MEQFNQNKDDDLDEQPVQIIDRRRNLPSFSQRPNKGTMIQPNPWYLKPAAAAVADIGGGLLIQNKGSSMFSKHDSEVGLPDDG